MLFNTKKQVSLSSNFLTYSIKIETRFKWDILIILNTIVQNEKQMKYT